MIKKIEKKEEASKTTQSTVKIETIKHNSQAIFLHDAKMCNPNGDSNDGNQPRWDSIRNIALSSPGRVKRYYRDYLEDYKGQLIFISKGNRNKSVVNAKTRMNEILEGLKEKNPEMVIEKDTVISETNVSEVLQKVADLIMFGGIIPSVTFGKTKRNVSFTGPIQTGWGESLTKYTGPIDSHGITSHFHSGKTSDEGESDKTTGAMGDMYCVRYALYGFDITINAVNAKDTLLTVKHVEMFDDAVINAIQLESMTATKKGQYPQLYIRVEYNTHDYTYPADFRSFITLVDKDNKEIPFDKTEELSSTDEYRVDLTKFVVALSNVSKKIEKIIFWKNPHLDIVGWNTEDGKLELGEKEVGIETLPRKDDKNVQ